MKRGIAIIPALLSCLALSAQNSNLNPTVQVTNEYQSSIADTDRKVMKVTVPDSLYKFDLNFDYTGFENPYKGNNEFNPFLTELDIAQRTLKFRDIYVKAGAGYTLHPVLESVFSFAGKGRFRAGVHANHKSYYGKYHQFDAAATDDTGYDAVTDVGFDCRSDWDKLSLIAGVRYDGVHTGNNFAYRDTRNYNSGSAMLKVMSNYNMNEVPWKYDFYAGYSYGGNLYVCQGDKRFGGEHAVSVGGSGNFKIRKSLLELTAGLDLKTGYDFVHYLGYAANITPRYHYDNDRINFAAGVDFLIAGGENVTNSGAFSLWPSIDFKWLAVPGYLNVFVNSGMRGSLVGQGVIARKYHFLLLDNSGENSLRVLKKRNVDLGLDGDVNEMFSWKLKAGYKWLTNADMATVALMAPATVELTYDPDLQYFDFGADIVAKFYGFSMDGSVTYNMYLNEKSHEVLPPALVANLRLAYDFRDRIGVYAGAEYRMSHVAGAYVVPDFINLYVGAEYRISNKLKVFLDGRNLLNRQLQYIPMYAERGIAITAGVVLNF